MLGWSAGHHPSLRSRTACSEWWIALDAKEHAVRGSLSRGMWNKCGKQRYQFQTVMMILMVKP